MPDGAGLWRPTPLVAGSVAAHGLGMAAIALLPATWAWVASGLFLNHLLLASAGMFPRNSLLGPNLDRFDGGSREVYVTFDDGPDPVVTPRILETLDRFDAKATFFCIGRKVAEQPQLTRHIAEAGHRVENHTYSHSNLFWFHGARALRRELGRTQTVIERAVGRAPVYFRAPAGVRSPLLDPMLTRAGLQLVSWTRRGLDTVNEEPGKVSARLLDGLSAGDVLLLHDGSCARTGDGEPVALAALEAVLEAARSKGLRCRPLPVQQARRPATDA